MNKQEQMEAFRVDVIYLLNEHGLSGSVEGSHDIYECLNKMARYYNGI